MKISTVTATVYLEEYLSVITVHIYSGKYVKFRTRDHCIRIAVKHL